MINLSINNFIFTLFIEFFTFLCIFHYFINQKSISKFIISLIVCIPIGIFTSSIMGAISYIFIFLILLLSNIQKNKKELIVISFLFSFLIIYTQGIIYNQIHRYIINSRLTENINFILCIYSLTFLIVALLISPLLKYMYTKIVTSLYLYSSKSAKKIYYLLVSLLVIILAITIILQFTNNQHISNMKIIAIIFISTFLFFISIFSFFLRKIKADFIYEKEHNELIQLISYTQKLEQQQQQLRKFKHDYLNILLSLQSSIQNENITEIKKIFSEISSYSKDILNDSNTNISDLSNIKVLPIKSIFMSKFFRWDDDIQKYVTFECITNVDNFFIDDIVLVRILGNLLDNAYEELKSQKINKFIRIAIINATDNIEITIENSLSTPIKNFHNLSISNYSTKENHAGLGLTTVKNLVEENVSLNLYTTINNDNLTFSVNLLIEKSMD